MTNKPEANAASTSLREVLLLDHRRLENLLEQLLAAFEMDANDAADLWSKLEISLERHFRLEERELFPELAKTAPAEVAALTRDHIEIRSRLTALGIGVDLHMTRYDMVKQLVAQLRIHAEREDALLYRWADKHMSQHRRVVHRALLLASFAPALRGDRSR